MTQEKPVEEIAHELASGTTPYIYDEILAALRAERSKTEAAENELKMSEARVTGLAAERNGYIMDVERLIKEREAATALIEHLVGALDLFKEQNFSCSHTGIRKRCWVCQFNKALAAHQSWKEGRS